MVLLEMTEQVVSEQSHPRQALRMTLDEFERYAELPENADKRLEYINAEVYEVPSNAYSSMIAMRIAYFIMDYLRKHDIGHVTGEGGGYKVLQQRYAPDVAFIRYERQAELDRHGYNSQAPDLVVEVVSPTDEPEKLRIKLSHYLAAGVVVWVINPRLENVEVYEAGKPAEVIERTGTLQGGAILPDFSLTVAELFPKPPAPTSNTPEAPTPSSSSASSTPSPTE